MAAGARRAFAKMRLAFAADSPAECLAVRNAGPYIRRIAAATAAKRQDAKTIPLGAVPRMPDRVPTVRCKERTTWLKLLVLTWERPTPASPSWTERTRR
ncbi:hypothetical protein EMEDMD4_440090 [Sinorhizobium medicae]|uniref:Uncharacterized protein n=1 Tax=Sinorhizobium medicae TaxID=110321 RepID=A0A508WZK6_9HYPH|nr:hypothetical protein EMEDMD4_440090 [Sinorhizobium medicae]